MNDFAEVIRTAKELLESMRYMDFYHSYEAKRLYQALTHYGVDVEVSGRVWSTDELKTEKITREFER